MICEEELEGLYQVKNSELVRIPESKLNNSERIAKHQGGFVIGIYKTDGSNWATSWDDRAFATCEDARKKLDGKDVEYTVVCNPEPYKVDGLQIYSGRVKYWRSECPGESESAQAEETESTR